MRNSRGRIQLGALCLALAITVQGCGGDGGSSGSTPPPPLAYTVGSGVAQKGPLIKGSTVTAQELDATLSPTGKQYSYQTTNDLGNFAPTSSFGSQYISVLASGYYFDEVADGVSSGTITLNGYSDLTVDTMLNVNLLTTLAYQRIQSLVSTSKMTFTAARSQAESEVLAALGIPVASYGSFDSFDVSGSKSGDQILAAVSSLFVYGNTAGTLSSLIANFQSDIGKNGVITSAATKSALSTAAKGLNPTAIAANLTQAYSSVGVVFSATNISDWIDQDADGVVGKFEFQVADASPSSVYTLPTFVATQVAGTSVSVSTGQLSVNGSLVTSAVNVTSSDVLAISPGPGTFPNGVVDAYLLSGGIRVAKVSFVVGLASIAVNPSALNLPIGVTQQFTATGTFSDGSTAVLSTGITWSSNPDTTAGLGATTGLAIGSVVGSTVITATSGSVSGTATLNVTAAIVESIAINPNPAFTGIGISTQLHASGTFSDGTTSDVTTKAAWTSSAPTVATVGPTTGLVTGVALGAATITATIGSVSATTALTITTHMWSPSGSMSTPRAYHTATLLPNGFVLVAGGNYSTQLEYTSNTAEVYNSASGTWSATGNLAVSRSNHTATLIPNGSVLAVGGFSGAKDSSATGTAEIYTPATGIWTTAAALPEPRVSHTATLLPNGKVLVAGGQIPGGFQPGFTDTATAELYDPTTGQWSSTGNMTVPHSSHTATLLHNGMVLVAGGDSTTCELYDPATETWTATGSYPINVYAPNQTLLTNGKVLSVGGYDELAANYVLTAELYDPTAGTWSPVAPLLAPINDSASLVLPDGTVLVAGYPANSSNSAPGGSQIFDPTVGTWTLSGNLPTYLYGLTMTLLPNGSVLGAGGDGGLPQVPLALAELYWQ